MPSVAVPWLMVRSPASVVERLPIVPVVELSVAIVPAVELTEPLYVPFVIVAVDEVSVWMVPLVMLAAVEVVVPAVRLVAVPAVAVVVPSVALLIVPFVIVALVLTVRFPVAVPKVRLPVNWALVNVPLVNASSNNSCTVTLLALIVSSVSAISILSAVETVVSADWSVINAG